MQQAMRWVHDRTVDGMNAGEDVRDPDAHGECPTTSTWARGCGTTPWERAGHLGEPRRLVPPPLHHRALRRGPLTVAPDLVAAAGADALVAAAQATSTAAAGRGAAAHRRGLAVELGHAGARRRPSPPTRPCSTPR